MALTDRQLERINALRAAQDVAIPLIAATPSAVNLALPMIRPWEPGKYAVNDIRMRNGISYKSVQAHDSGANPGWTPEATPALWMQYHGTSPETARPYIAPTGAHDAYQKDEYAIENGKTYRCKTNATTWPPSQVAANWEMIKS